MINLKMKYTHPHLSDSRHKANMELSTPEDQSPGRQMPHSYTAKMGLA